MAKEEVDVDAVRAEFMAKRQKEIDAKKPQLDDDRSDGVSGFQNPPSVRATDGNRPGTPHEDVLAKAEELNAAESGEEAPAQTKAKKAK